MVKTQTYRIQMAMPTQSKQKVKFQLLRWVNMLIICEPWKLSMSIHMHKLRHVYTYIYIYRYTSFSVPSCFLPQPLPVICSTNVHTAPPPNNQPQVICTACSLFFFYLWINRTLRWSRLGPPRWRSTRIFFRGCRRRMIQRLSSGNLTRKCHSHLPELRSISWLCQAFYNTRV